MTGKILPVAKYGLLCDDIREEKHNKFTLVGLYTSKIILNNTLPALFPKLCMRICFDVSRPYKDDFNVFIRRPNKSVMGPFLVKVTPAKDQTGESFLNITMCPFPVDSEGSYELIAENEGKEEMLYRFFVETTAGPSSNPNSEDNKASS